MDPITLAALIGAGTQVAGGIATGIGKARAGKKMMLTPAQEKELEELQKRQQTGELGLTERQRGAMTQRFLAEQAGAQRELEAAALQQAAARAQALCAQKKQAAEKVSSACSLKRCTTNYQCVEPASAPAK